MQLEKASDPLPKKRHSEHRALLESEIGAMPGAVFVRRANQARRITVTVLLRPGPTELKAESLDESGLKLPNERSHLTRVAFAAAHGPNPADVRKTIRVLRRYGLQVIGRNQGARSIQLSGTIANLRSAFKVSLSIYRYAGGRYLGRTGMVYIPSALHGIVQAVFGLDNRPAARPHFRPRRRLGGGWANALEASYTPPEVARLYNFPQGVDGAGQCIGIIELAGGFGRRDLNIYFRKLGIAAPKIIAVPVGGSRNRPTGNPNGPDGEVMLDIEIAGAIAPGARIVVYFAPNTAQGFLQAIHRAVHDHIHRPTVISISWGKAEAAWSRQSLTAFNQAFQAAAAMGVSVCVATGDGGSSDGVPGRRAHVDFPSSSPFALACGGTSLYASEGEMTLESVWNDGPGGGSGGGGVSDAFPRPSWQANTGVPASVNPGHSTGRGLPDLAGSADEDVGYEVRVDGVNTVIGGTSAVAPLTASLIALLNQSLGTNIGYLNPILYSNLGKSGGFRDIVKGNNDVTGKVGGYKAHRGWDPCTGFGSPNGKMLLAGLKAPPKSDLDARDDEAHRPAGSKN